MLIMARLEEFTPDAMIRGILPNELVKIVKADWYRSDTLKVIYEDAAGSTDSRLIFRHDEHELEVVDQGRPWSFKGDRRLLVIDK